MPTNLDEIIYQNSIRNSEIKIESKNLLRVVDELNKFLLETHSDLFTKALLEENANEKIREIIKKYVIDEKLIIDGYPTDHEVITKVLVSEVIEFGPITKYLFDKSVTEIYVNGYDEIRIERNGQAPVLTDDKFTSVEQAINIAKRILRNVGKTISPNDSSQDAILPDGSRINIKIAPAAIRGISMDIRKHFYRPFTEEEYVKPGILTDRMVEFLKMIVEGRQTVFVIGPTGSGKTSLMRFLCDYIPDEERIITIEDTPELNLLKLDSNGRPINHIVAWQTDPNAQVKVTLQSSIKDALRNKPDRIIIGEVRGEEALDMISATQTGHPGMSSYHAKDLKDAIERLLVMCKMSGTDLSERILYKMITNAVNFIVVIRKLSDFSRKVLEITEIRGVDENNNVIVNPIFKFIPTGKDENGKILGTFKQVGEISEDTYYELLLSGIDEKRLESFKLKE
ncbi:MULTISPECIES: CpaF family protein [Thermoanaerobacterium]|uniref:Flp pilus assembly protein, ATPase CpaF n=3 Tax=Thermoanaerobacterium TaxID=28895 RepID=L0INE1_THETR|nr:MULTISPECIES: ATPase, T2SS/T4P/T4SS family [Thermoanaerobacterium]AFK94332.1 type II secretion system protein E [Thermoanaerobacterium saccharolyticum JW/SL-YS485]AGB20368.1 Flp pilus assembly protein, ATPase CpaF [Thermoanaerobacterium thermosaccharolyticum M0795]ETO39102.1 type II secretion system protein E [Thermoanaerobacterium aotearoense SCUT27]